MKPLVFGLVIVLALLIGGLLYYLPQHGSASSKSASPNSSPALVDEASNPSHPALASAHGEQAANPTTPTTATPTAPVAVETPPPPAYNPPPMSAIDDIIAKLRDTHDERAHDLLMHEFVATAAKMDLHDQMIARDHLDTIEHKYDAPTVVPPSRHFEANADGGE